MMTGRLVPGFSSSISMVSERTLTAVRNICQVLDAIAEGIAITERTGERLVEAELYRLKGELILRSSGVEPSRIQPPVQHKLSGPKLSGPLRTRSVAPCPTGWREVTLATSTDVWCETTTWKKNRGPDPSGPLGAQSAAPCPKGWREVAP